MLFVARAIGRILRIAAFALILTFGVLPANANESSIWAALERPDDAFLWLCCKVRLVGDVSA